LKSICIILAHGENKKIFRKNIKMKLPNPFSKRSQDLELISHDSRQLYFIKTEILLYEKKQIALKYQLKDMIK
jgi:CMP-N-acetylneuraminic acid synthetase